jgi:hypothetical protein
MNLTIEPLADAANELALHEVQALVIMGDDRDLHTCPPNEIFRCAAGKSKTDLSGFDNETDALGAIKHP